MPVGMPKAIPPCLTLNHFLSYLIAMSDKQDLSSAPQDLVGMIGMQTGSVVSRALISKSAGTITLFAFDAGEGLSEHTAPYDALVQILDGEADIRVGGQPHIVKAGQILLLPANVPHALQARVGFKMLLTMIRV